MKKMKKHIAIFFLTFIAIVIANKVSAQTIGPHQNGTFYEVTSISYKWIDDPVACGWTGEDNSSPRQAQHKIETRRYYVIQDGKEVKSWYQTVDVGWTGNCQG
jgi:hypothetical protein